MFATLGLRRLTALLLFFSISATMWNGADRTAEAAEVADICSSLRLVPADASFYQVMLRNREQMEIFLASRAYAELRALPIVQQGLDELMKEGGPWQMIEAQLQVPDNQDLIALLKNMGSEEIFLYGNPDVNKLLELLMTLNAVNRFGPLFGVLQGDGGSPDYQVQLMLETLVENEHLMVVPDIVMGFKTDQEQSVDVQLDRLNAVVTLAMTQAPPEVRERLKVKKTTIGGGPFLSLHLSGEMLPWEELDEDDMPLAPAERDKLLAKVKSLTVDVSIGFAHGYFFISVGDNNEHIENFGQGEGLATTDKLQRLGPHAGERITDISYVSKELLASARDTKEDVRELASLAEEWLPLAELDEEVEKRILSDVKELTNDLAEYVTEPGAVVSCNYLSDRGVEGYTYNWNENLLLDPSRKLPILSHLGGSPLMAFVTRTKYSPEHYELLVKWLKKGHTYVEQFLVEELSPSEQAQYQTIWARVLPLLRRLDTATGEMLLPSLADGQTALVIDSRLRTDQWIAMLPRTKDPMPVLEPALLMGVSDAELLKKAMSEYRAIVNQGIKLASELSGGQVPPLELPPPEKRSFDEGDIYFYRFPEMVGLYKKLAINGGLNDEVAVVSLVPLQTKRLLGDTPLDVTGPLSRAQDQQLASASYFDCAAFIDVLRPWIKFGVEMGFEQSGAQFGELGPALESEEPADEAPGEEKQQAERAQEENEDEDLFGGAKQGELPPPLDSPEEVLDHVNTVLDVLQCLRLYSSVTYQEDGAMVTHSLLEVQDLPVRSGAR